MGNKNLKNDGKNEGVENIKLFFKDGLNFYTLQEKLLEAVHALHEIGTDPRTIGNLKRVFKEIAKRSKEILEADAVILYPYYPDMEKFETPPIMEGIRKKVAMQPRITDKNVVVEILKSEESHFANDAKTDTIMSSKSKGKIGFVKREEIESSAGLRLVVGNKIVGILFINYREPHKFSKEERRILKRFASRAAMAIEHARLYELERVREITHEINSTLDFERRLNLIVEGASKLIGTQNIRIRLLKGDELVPIVDRGLPMGKYTWKINECIVGHVAKTGKPLKVDDVRKNKYFKKAFKKFKDKDTGYVKHLGKIRSEIAVSLKVKGEVIGVLNAHSPETCAFTYNDIELLCALAEQAANAIENARIYQELDNQINILEELHRVGTEITKNIEQTPVLREITKRLGELIEVDIPMIHLYDNEKDEFSDVFFGDIRGEWRKCEPRPEGSGSKAIAKNEIIDTNQKGPGVSKFAKDKGVETTVTVPLISGDKPKPLGIMYMHFLGEKYEFSDDEKAKHKEYALQICNIFNMIGIHQKLKDNVDVLKERFCKEIKKENIVERIKEFGGIEKGDIVLMYLFDKEKEKFEDLIFGGIDDKRENRPRRDGVGIKSIRERKVIVTNDGDKEKPKMHGFFKDIGVKTTVTVPIIFEYIPLGVMYLHYHKRHIFAKDKKEKLCDLAEEVGDIIKRAGIHQKIREKIDELSEIFAEEIDEEDVFKNITKATNVDILPIHLYCNERCEFGDVIFAGLGRDWGSSPPRPSGAGQTSLDKNKIITVNHDDEERPGVNPDAKQKGVKTTIAVPLKFENIPLGVIYMHFLGNKHKLTKNEERAIRVYADEVAITIRNTRSYQDLKKIADVGGSIMADLDKEEMGKRIATGIERVIGGGIPNIYLYDPEIGFEFLACGGGKEEEKLGRVPPGENGIGKRVIDTRKPIILNQDQALLIFPDNTQRIVSGEMKVKKTTKLTISESAKEHKIKTVACFPLRFGKDILGILYLHFKNERKFTSDDKLKISILANQATSAITNMRRYMTLERILKESGLPDRPNRELEIEPMGVLNDLIDGLPYDVVEVEELFQRLFPKKEKIIIKQLSQGFSGAKVVKVMPDLLVPVVVKFGISEYIRNEVNNYDEHVDDRIDYSRITIKRRQCFTSNLGGIIYSFVGSAGRIRSFNEYYKDKIKKDELGEVIKTLETLFGRVYKNWWRESEPKVTDLFEEYENYFRILDRLEDEVFTEDLAGYRGCNKIKFPELGDLEFDNPVYWIRGKNYIPNTDFCRTHGDLNGNNILVDSKGEPWLIDFGRTGIGHIFRDIIELETVIKFELLETEDILLLHEFEQKLVEPNTFDEFDSMEICSNWPPDLINAFQVIKKLRQLAWNSIGRDPMRDANEYYVGLLYQTLNTARWLDVRRKHAFLSAGIICKKLKTM